MASERFGELQNPLRLSMGIASLHSDHPESADELVAMADRALYACKEAGRNSVVVHDPEVHG